jgi:hypothetical protein
MHGSAVIKINPKTNLITINPQKQGIPSLGGVKERKPLCVTGEFCVKSSSGY